MTKKKVFIDLGHGGTDPGAVANKLVEKDMTRATGYATKYELEKYGVDVLLSRTGDTYPSLSARSKAANNWGADLFVSEHYNAGGGDRAEVIHSVANGVSKELAQNIINAIKTEIGQNIGNPAIYSKKGSDGKDYFAVIRETKMPAVIVEPAFIDSDDRFIVDTVAEQQEMGRAIAHGILTTLGIDYKAKPEKPAVSDKPKPTPVAPKPPANVYAGKKLVSKTNNLRFYAKPSWADKDLVGTVNKGLGFPVVLGKVKVNGSDQYKVQNSKGATFYITAADKYVELKNK
ncbi:N-acetylmuramoyl-L-alanine amidase family protein [Listeria booriae]|uniref:N-acetylmuramoyl-L-alanine amidase family protein n=1 Tax=Listeria booriae TaxID=1552123 RepID=UPI001629F678|nr:N-acetylmuramoyl-L-alanine amidase [Listeria booriae]MBC2392197.1 N-acetylmuramoyl-L-alanine amidase [Listeria booriae]